MRTKARVLLSGGMDSTVCLVWALETFREVDAVAFDYGQRHRRELDAARAIADRLGVRLDVRQLGGLSGSLTGDGDDLSSTGAVVPGRNAQMLEAALWPDFSAAFLVMGACRDDWGVFADCRPEFFAAWRPPPYCSDTRVVTPVLHRTKADVVRVLFAFGRESLLSMTWSCYAGGDSPCGECGACIARAEGFRVAGKADPC